MKRVAFICLIFFCRLHSVHALGYDHGRSESHSEWPEGLKDLVDQPECVHGFCVNWEDTFFYSGDTASFAGFLKEYAALKSITSHKLTLHQGVGAARSPWDKNDRASCDWKVDTVPQWTREYAKNPNTKDAASLARTNKDYFVEIDLWLGGHVDFGKVQVPSNVTVVAADLAVPAEQELKLRYELAHAVLVTQDTNKIDELLKRGVDVNAPIGCGTFNALDGAVANKNPAMLKLLLVRGAKPRGRELAGAAFTADHEQALQMARVLLQAGVDPNARSDYSNPLIQASYRGNLELVKLLLAQPGIKLDETDVDGHTALMWAADHGSLEIVDLLLQAGASVQVTNKQGDTAISLAGRQLEKQRTIVSKLRSAPR